MEKADYMFLESVEEIFDLQPRIVEFGSRIIGEQGNLAIRKIFPEKSNNKDYVGVDFIEGDGVDVVANIESLDLPDKFAKTVIAMNLLEHVEKFWLAMENIKRIAEDDAIFMFVTPFSYDIHACPHDYYRYTPFFYKNQFKDYKYGISMTLGYELRPKLVYYIASNNPVIKQKAELLKESFEKKYRRKIPKSKSIIFNLRSKVCGSFFKLPIKYHADINFEVIEN